MDTFTAIIWGGVAFSFCMGVYNVVQIVKMLKRRKRASPSP